VKLRTLFLLAALSVAALAGAFQHQRSITVTQPGPTRLDLDIEILARAQPLRYDTSALGATSRFNSGLDDLRLFDARGSEIPYALIAPRTDESWKKGSVAAIPVTKFESGFQLDLGRPERIDALHLEGLPSPLLKRFRLDGSNDAARWVVLRASDTLFDLPDENLQRLKVEFEANDFRYLRVTWDDRSSARMPLPRATARLASGELLAARVASVPFERRVAEAGKSRYRLRLPGPELPLAALQLNVGVGHVLRNAQVIEGRLSGSEVLPVVIGEKTIKRVERPEGAAADLAIPIQRPRGSELELVIDDGNNAPLEMEAINVVFAPLPWIYFEPREAGTVTARFGSPTASAPRYDIAAAADDAARRTVFPARWASAPSAAAASATPSSQIPRGAKVDRSSYAHEREVSGLAAGLNALLLDASVLARSRGTTDVRLVDGREAQVPYVVERRAEPLIVKIAVKAESPNATGTSRYRIELPYDALPAGELVVTTRPQLFRRTVRLLADARDVRGDGEGVIATTEWSNAVESSTAPPLRIALDRRVKRTMYLEIDDGDNAPLPIDSAALQLPATRLRFFAQPGEKLRLLYGNGSAQEPRYDLALMTAQLLTSPAHEISLAATPAAEGVEEAALPRSLFWGGLIVTALILLFLAARLVRNVES
jgi:hypothetical protein